jgi:Na+-driven multidrug efflux pump
MAIGGVISVLVFALVQIWPTACAALFIDPESPTMRMCVHAIRVCFIMLPFLPVNVISTAYFQSTAQSLKAFVLSISRAVIFMIPCVLILPSLFQLEGVWFALPISDFFAIILAVVLLVRSISTLKSEKDLGMAPPLKAASMTSKK